MTAIVLLHAALLACYALLYPPYVAFDEPQHVDMVVAIAEDGEYPAPAERELALGVAQSSDTVYGGKQLRGPYTAENAVPRDERRSLTEYGGTEPAPTPPRYPNQMTQHPPAYYGLVAVVAELVPGEQDWAFDRAVVLFRLASALLLAPLPLLLWLGARRLLGDGPPAVSAAALPLLVPGMTRTGGSVNNDVLVMIVSAALLVLLARVLTGDLSRRTAAGVGAVCAVALLTKGTAMPVLVAVPLAYAVGWRRTGARLPCQQLAVVGAVASLGGWWWVRNLVTYGALQPSGYGPEAEAAIEATAPPPPWTVDRWWPHFERLEGRFWSALGMIDIPSALPEWTVRALTVAAVVAIVFALVAGSDLAGGRWTALVLLTPFVLLFVALVETTLSAYLDNGLPAGIQGRYLYGGAVILAPVVAAGAATALGRLRRFQAIGVVAAGVGVQALAVGAVLRGFYLPGDRSVDRLNNLREAADNLAAWSPFPPGVTALPFVLAAVLALAALAAAALSARSEPARAEPAAPQAVHAA